jgi:Domain of unknown function (DUF4386)
MSEIQRQARRAGWLYLLVGLSAPFGLIYVPGRLIVSGNATLTADHIRASEFLLRAGIASELFHQAVFIFLVLALYQLLKQVDESQARLMVILGALVSVPIVFMNVVYELAALALVSGSDYLSVFNEGQLDAWAYMFLRMHGQGIIVAGIFWGLWLFPFGVLVIRSGFIPRLLGWLLILAGIGNLAGSCTSILFPAYRQLIDPLVMILQCGELPVLVWLLFWGGRAKLPGARILPVGQ